jgi:hypothetical protein
LLCLLALLGAADQAHAISFAAPSVTGTSPRYTVAAAQGDFDRDGRLDLATAYGNPGTLTVHKGSGTGTFSTQLDQQPSGQGSYSALDAADLDGVNGPDIVVGNQNGQNLTIFLNDGDGTFTQAGSAIATGGGVSSVKIVDMTGDGKLDVVTTITGFNNWVRVFDGNGTGGFTAGQTITVGQTPNSTAIADFDLDGRLDIAVAMQNAQQMSLLLTAGGVNYSVVNHASGRIPEGITAGDFDGDLDADIAVINNDDDEVVVWLNDGAGDFGDVSARYTVQDEPQDITSADMNLDGKLDLVVANQYSNSISYLAGAGDGTFAAPQHVSPIGGNNPMKLLVGDYTGDGRPDLFVGQNNFQFSTLANTTVPNTQVDTGPIGATNQNAPAFTFSSPDNRAATFECALDGPGAATGTFDDCVSGQTYPGLADGAYTFRVRAADTLGNTDATPASRAFTVDTVAPSTTLDTATQGASNQDDASFTFSSDDAAATFECRLTETGDEPDDFAACTTPATFTGLADGTYTFEVRAKDAAGNVDASPATAGFTVDTTGPDANIYDGPSGTIRNTEPYFGIESPDPTATFECALDGPAGATGTFAACTAGDYADLEDGDYTFRVRATDGVGNVGPETTRSFTVDTREPVVTITGGPEDLTNVTTQSFTFTVDETDVETECALDGPGQLRNVSFTSCASGVEYADLADGEYRFTVSATDAAGNGSSDSRSFTVDTTAPDTEITFGPEGTREASAVDVYFTSDEYGEFECRLTGPGQTSAFTACESPKAYTDLAPGDYTFAVRATDEAGNTDPTPATRAFTLKAIEVPTTPQFGNEPPKPPVTTPTPPATVPAPPAPPVQTPPAVTPRSLVATLLRGPVRPAPDLNLGVAAGFLPTTVTGNVLTLPPGGAATALGFVCSSQCTIVVLPTITLGTKGKASAAASRQLKLKKTTLKLAANKAGRVAVRLTKAQRAQVRKAGSATLRLKTTVTAGAKKTTDTQVLKLRVKKP